MNLNPPAIFSIDKKTAVFCSGLVVVLLAFLLPLPTEWNTFMLGWRVEVVASLFIAGSFAYSYLVPWPSRPIGKSESRLIVLPIIAIAAWSAVSMLWAASPMSALQHSLTWWLYLLFYLAFREILEQRRSASLLLRCFVGCLCIFAALAVLAQITLIFVGRSTQIGIIYSKFGEQAITIAPLVLVGVLRSNGRRFKIGLAGFSLLWLLIFCSSSRTSIGLFLLFLVLVGAAVIVLKSWRRFRLKFAVVCTAVLLLPLSLVGLSALVGKGDVSAVSRVKDSQNLSSSNDFRLLMYKLAWEMFADRPLTGVGANNFGWEVNRYRLQYSTANPNDLLLAQAETTVPERTHNEYLQVASELGVTGIMIFGWFLVGIAVLAVRSLRNVRRPSPQGVSAVLGLCLFLVSSLVTSYSFRLVQNGVTFFFILAVATRLLLRERSSSETQQETEPSSIYKLVAVAAGLILIGVCGIRVASEHLTYQGNAIADLAAAETRYRIAMRLDPKNPDAPYALGRRLINSGLYAEAVPLLRTAIKIGRASSTDYSYLATAQSLAGDNVGAEQTFAEAAVLYPRSPFVLTRHSVLLANLGRYADSQKQFDRAATIDPAAANTWQALISRGSQYASDLAFQRNDYSAVMDLEPYDSIYAVVEERDIRFPEERMKLSLSAF